VVSLGDHLTWEHHRHLGMLISRAARFFCLDPTTSNYRPLLRRTGENDIGTEYNWSYWRSFGPNVKNRVSRFWVFSIRTVEGNPSSTGNHIMIHIATLGTVHFCWRWAYRHRLRRMFPTDVCFGLVVSHQWQVARVLTISAKHWIAQWIDLLRLCFSHILMIFGL
jgi:hypothetical protein